MINLEKQLEQDLKTLFSNALTTAEITDVSYRCFWLDDETGKEEPSFPCIQIKTSPSGPAEETGYKSPFREMTAECIIYTFHAEDKKRDTLGDIWEVIDHTIYNSDITSGSGLVSAVEIWRPDAGDCDVVEVAKGVSLNMVSFSVNINCCYQFSA